MKLKMFFLVLPILGLLMVSGSQKADAFDISVGIGSRHHYDGGSYVYRTTEPTYSTWYPADRGYVYTPPTYYSSGNTYYNDGSSTVYTTTPTYYSTYPSTYHSDVEFNTWYGSGREYRHRR